MLQQDGKLRGGVGEDVKETWIREESEAWATVADDSAVAADSCTSPRLH